jgi:hypothetical protein
VRFANRAQQLLLEVDLPPISGHVLAILQKLVQRHVVVELTLRHVDGVAVGLHRQLGCVQLRRVLLCKQNAVLLAVAALAHVEATAAAATETSTVSTTTFTITATVTASTTMITTTTTTVAKVATTATSTAAPAHFLRICEHFIFFLLSGSAKGTRHVSVMKGV